MQRYSSPHGCAHPKYSLDIAECGNPPPAEALLALFPRRNPRWPSGPLSPLTRGGFTDAELLTIAARVAEGRGKRSIARELGRHPESVRVPMRRIRKNMEAGL